MQDYEKLSELMERTIHKYIQVEKLKRSYGTNMMLSRSEIHTVAAVGDHPDINVTMLGKLLGITKGASSQMIYKLVDKGLVEKRVSPNSDTEVILSLTEIGKTAYESHRQYHATSNEYFFQQLRGLPKETEEKMVEILTEFDKAMDARLAEKDKEK